jgi:hypothetical protein
VKKMLLESLDHGGKWILLENFENTTDIRNVLSHHIRIDQDFHPGYRLWIITAPTDQFPAPELRQCLKLTWDSPISLRDSIFTTFTKGPIKDAKCWSGDRQAIGSCERHITRLIYCLSFFHAAINDRRRYKSIGGWSCQPTFSPQDIILGVLYLEVICREFDPIPFDGLIDLLGDCGYANAFKDLHDRRLLASILDNCINEKAVSTNRYRFSSTATDFFVPNKTLFKDYIEFIKVRI